jgi:dTDP-4-dehydrorhamnose 3,5-epimerase
MAIGSSSVRDGGEFSSGETPIHGVVAISRFEHKDARGSFSQIFNQDEFFPLGRSLTIQQVNFSSTAMKGTIRGMHAQPGGIPEYKLVTCVRGAVWDVCVDLRKKSPTFLRWKAVELSENNALSLLIPPGVAHGFQAMSDDVELVYCHSAPYDPDSEIGVSAFDPLLAIPWPLGLSAISDRDRNHRPLPPTFEGLST